MFKTQKNLHYRKNKFVTNCGYKRLRFKMLDLAEYRKILYTYCIYSCISRPTYKSNWKNKSKKLTKIDLFQNHILPSIKSKYIWIINFNLFWWAKKLTRVYVELIKFWPIFVQNFSNFTRVYTAVLYKFSRVRLNLLTFEISQEILCLANRQ